jgi:hypothetical protein
MDTKQNYDMDTKQNYDMDTKQNYDMVTKPEINNRQTIHGTGIRVL